MKRFTPFVAQSKSVCGGGGSVRESPKVALRVQIKPDDARKHSSHKGSFRFLTGRRPPPSAGYDALNIWWRQWGIGLAPRWYNVQFVFTLA